MPETGAPKNGVLLLTRWSVAILFLHSCKRFAFSQVYSLGVYEKPLDHLGHLHPLRCRWWLLGRSPTHLPCPADRRRGRHL
jgi:hypothetical protein